MPHLKEQLRKLQERRITGAPKGTHQGWTPEHDTWPGQQEMPPTRRVRAQARPSNPSQTCSSLGNLSPSGGTRCSSRELLSMDHARWAFHRHHL